MDSIIDYLFSPPQEEGGGGFFISNLVKNDITLGVWIEKDRRTIGTGDAGVFLIRYPTIQRKGTKTCSYWFIFFSNERHTICLVKNTLPQAVWIEKDRKTIGTADVFFLVYWNSHMLSSRNEYYC